MSVISGHLELYIKLIDTIEKLKLFLELEDRQPIIEQIQQWINILEHSANKRYQLLVEDTIMDYYGIYDENTIYSITKAALDYVESTK